MRYKYSTRILYKLTSISIDEILKSYIKVYRETSFKPVEIVSLDINHPEFKYKKGETKKYQSILKDKLIFTTHIIISRYLANGCGVFSLNASILQQVIGKDYHTIIKCLIDNNIIHTDNTFIIGTKSKRYILCKNVEFTSTTENISYLNQYFKKLFSILESRLTEKIKAQMSQLQNDKLYQRYNDALKLLKLKYRTECREFISLHKFISPNSKHYYEFIENTYLTEIPKISSIDNNNRIYSIATLTPRLLKPFLNIKFTCDIHNSHPLLFNSIIYNQYNIKLSIRKDIVNAIGNIILNNPYYNCRYDRRFIRKLLIDNGVEKEDIAKIPSDVLHYIFLTSTGQFWDTAIDLEEDTLINRGDIKILMFSEVFYSKKLSTRGQKYGKRFKDKFPNVYKIVRKQKFEDRKRLANDMMKLESKLFQKVLTLLYNKRFKVISIHDAIVVLDVKANGKCSEEVVRNIIMTVYKEEGLHPDISIDYYGDAYVNEIIENEYKVVDMVEDYITNLNAEADNGNEEAKQILVDLNDGFFELIPNRDYTRVQLHPTDIKAYIGRKKLSSAK